MISVAAAWGRLRQLQAFSSLRDADFRPCVYSQAFTALASGAQSSAQAMTFPGGAVILGITANGYVPSAAIGGQAFNNRQNFGLNFAYTTGESLTPTGPVIADALLGGGEDTIFPVKELVLAPNQALLTTVQNFSTATLTVHVLYHCLIYRFAQ